MNDNIFGYSWDDIQRAQRGGRLSRPVVFLEPTWNEEDDRLLAIHKTAEGLRTAGFHGVADRHTRRASGEQGG